MSTFLVVEGDVELPGDPYLEVVRSASHYPQLGRNEFSRFLFARILFCKSLINTRTRDLGFVYSPKKGSYAILSHTWGAHEVSFQQYPRKPTPAGAGDHGLAKINKTCELALARNPAYAWVDTCCIDKSSSAELSDAINSIFQWYRDAAVRFAFIPDRDPNVHFNQGFPACNWLRGGWKLQELIAPRHVEFYDRDWNLRSIKAESMDVIAASSGIDREVLDDNAKLPQVAVARRMSWASMRKTTRVENIAKKDLRRRKKGLTAKRKKAFFRLQEEIVKQSCDLSLFAWKAVPPTPQDNGDEDDELSSGGVGRLCLEDSSLGHRASSSSIAAI
ncbi:hypothetical protein B0H63DRAFT_453648 [Podospora didyma]|uniref:Heterokaryon incompatibility domain-containing protein n=1 Tax=Podospora didyma TaxID=330526 RepID=A0AAE0K8U8_9PEZI|nr:hypothetical protein B0H63DRAFT_453648 [Podospora didyma]